MANTTVGSLNLKPNVYHKLTTFSLYGKLFADYLCFPQGHIPITTIQDALNVPIILKDIGLAVVGHSNYAGFQSGLTGVPSEDWNTFNARALNGSIRVCAVGFKTRG